MPQVDLQHPYTTNSLTNLISAATCPDATAFGLVIKVRDKKVLNWMYADVSVLRSIAVQRGSVTFRFADTPQAAKTLRQLALSLAEATPFRALMIRYKGKNPTATAWEFIDLAFIKDLTA